eukprot:CCRYP_020056-RA/>CCRYP_020056-RA protein AED:0.21 eAED:0.21 QI:0/1/0.88/1/0.37/0.33/9/2200/1156
MTTSLPLKHWIKGALESSSIGKGTAALSPAYFASALRIAIDLTRQISDAEDLSDSGLFHGIASLPPPFPVACVDWADCITVSLKPHDDICKHGESSLQFPSSSSLSDQMDDLDELLDKIAQDIENDETELPNENQVSTGEMKQHGSDASYFNVDCAQIFYSEGAATYFDSSGQKLQRIYSLGLVFYELFSGGEQPPVELLVVASPNGRKLVDMAASQVEKKQPRSDSSSGFLLNDFKGTLNVSDGMSPARGGTLSGSLNHDPVDHYDSNNGYHAVSISTKRQSVSRGSRKCAASSSGATLCDVTFDCLSMKGVPRRLCDLICNMIDCINGDFMGNESYNEMCDVTCDMQLMLYKPSVYLQDLDVHKLSLSGLELNDTVFERKDEFTALQCSYRRSISGTSELAIITGMSGTGKSTMANRIGNFITASGGLFLSGKFDQMMHQAKPFSAVASAFNNYCDALTRVEESERALLVAAKLQSELGSDLYYLIQVIPNLSQIIYENPPDIPPNQDDCVDAQQRLQYLFCQFVEVISYCSGGPLTLFIDDVQWADPASISMIGQLLKKSRSMQDNTRVFFLATGRDDEMESGHSFWKMIEDVSNFGFKTTVVKLSCMDKDTVTEVVSNLLHLSPRLLRTLSDIVYYKTKGNPLFVLKMLLSLERDGLLRLSLPRHRWEWDEEKIQSRKLPDDVAMFFVQSINTLPIDVKIALGALSCFGASAECEVMRALETDLKLNLKEPLNVAIAEGLVNNLNGKYCFCHDRIQEAAYSMIEEEDRCLHHMNYGLSLMNRSMRGDEASLLFTAVTQLNLGGPSAVQHAENYQQIANCNLIAGKKAMEMSDFSLAFSFFDHGMTFLRKKHWQDQYDLSLELFNLAAKCALAIEDLTSLTMICVEVSRNARNSEETLSSSLTLMSALTHSRISESVQFGFQVLSKLGVDIPHSSSREQTLKLISQTQSTLDGISDSTLLSYHTLSDYKKVMAMKFLAKLEHSIQQTNTSLQPLVTIKIIQLTIEHGMSPMSAIGFAYFGGMLAELGDLRGGHRYSQLTKALLEKYQCNEIAGEVFFLSTELLSYIEPLQVTNEYRIQGQAAAMTAGDIHWACMNKLMFTCTLLWQGANLSGVREAFTNAGYFAKEHDHRTSLYYMFTFQRSISTLIGEEGAL